MRPKRKEENLSVAKMLRNNMTPEERKLWYDFLKTYPVRFRRQHRIGKYIVDFYCPAVKLAVELDGSQHRTPKGIEEDAERTAYLNACGIKVIRFSNYRIKRCFSSSCEHIHMLVSTYLNGPFEQYEP